MPIAVRTAQTVWEGSLASGSGEVTGATDALGTLPVTWAARTEQPGGKTSPEELAAAAHSSCFAMALTLTLGEHKATVKKLTVDAAVTLDEKDGAPTVVSSAITVNGEVPGMDDAAFQDIVKEAAAVCPISRLFTGANITVSATLAS